MVSILSCATIFKSHEHWMKAQIMVYTMTGPGKGRKVPRNYPRTYWKCRVASLKCHFPFSKIDCAKFVTRAHCQWPFIGFVARKHANSSPPYMCTTRQPIYSFHIHWKPSAAKQCDSNSNTFARKTPFKCSQLISACVQNANRFNWQQMFFFIIEQCDNLCYFGSKSQAVVCR